MKHHSLHLPGINALPTPPEQAIPGRFSIFGVKKLIAPTVENHEFKRLHHNFAGGIHFEFVVDAVAVRTEGVGHVQRGVVGVAYLTSYWHHLLLKQIRWTVLVVKLEELSVGQNCAASELMVNATSQSIISTGEPIWNTSPVLV